MDEKLTLRGSGPLASVMLAVAAATLPALNGCSPAGSVTFGSGDESDLAMAEELGLRELEMMLRPHGIDARRDLVVTRVFVDDLSMAHTRVQQTVRGVPVFGGEAIVHLGRDGSVFAITDDLVRGLRADLDTTPTLSAEDAVDRALAERDCPDCLTDEPRVDLFVLRRGGRDRLVHRVSLRREDGTPRTSMPVVFIDAHTGDKVWEYDNLQTAQGTGNSLYSGVVSITTYLKSGTYYMEDTTRKIGTFDLRNTMYSVYRFTDADNSWVSSAQRAGVDAHWGATKTYDYFENAHGLNGIDGTGGPSYYTSADGSTKLISSRVHYGKSYNGAYWNGSFMTYGDGDGAAFSPLVTVDVCGHEMTHGITERTAGLVYAGEPGALNESMSDVFAAMIELYADGVESADTWKLGEDAYTPGTPGDALRYMDDPHSASNGGYTADDDPDHYSERYTGAADNGGVHVNSGIPNKAFYLLAKGGSHHLGGSMTGIGTADAASIWFAALTTYMTSSTTFCGARAATRDAASALFGPASTQYTRVGEAWDLVGVTASLCGGPG